MMCVVKFPSWLLNLINSALSITWTYEKVIGIIPVTRYIQETSTKYKFVDKLKSCIYGYVAVENVCFQVDQQEKERKLLAKSYRMHFSFQRLSVVS